jgi:hypothetical protein
MRILVPFLVFGLTAAPACGQEIVAQSNTPKCSATQQSDWDITTKDALGVIGHDLEQRSLGSIPANRILRKNWWPLQDVKMPICGTLHHFDWHSGDVFTSADEQDWNNFLIPSPAFQQVFRDALPTDRSQVWRCGEEYCMEAEITPNSRFYENPWWSKKAKKSELVGKQLCAYGAFVEEEWHGRRPEIHPSELYWWRDNETHSYSMLLQEDASGRFDKEGNYANLKQAPPTWRPWAQAPRNAEFRLAFVLGESRQSQTYFINERSSFNAKPVVPSDSTIHTLKHGDGNLVVTEVGAVNQHIKVTFADLCLTDSHDLEGYIAITTAVGLEKSPASGGQELLEITSTQVPVIAPAIIQSQITLLAGTPRLVVSKGQEQEIGYLSLGPNSSKPLVEGITKINLMSASENPILENPPSSGTARQGIWQGLDVVKGAELEIQMQSGEKKQIEIPPLGLALSIKEEAAVGPSAKATRTDEAAIVKATGADIQQGLVLNIVQHKDVRLVLGVHYAPQEAGELRAEDSSPFSERLNKVLMTKDPVQITKTLGSVYPFKAEWKFEGWEFFADGSSIEFPVASNASGTDDQIGTHWHSRTMVPTLAVEFPSGRGRLFKVVATGTYTDPTGASGKITDEIWNQEIFSPPTEVDKLLDSVATAGGLTDGQRNTLLSREKATAGPLEYLSNSGARQANLLRLQAQRASETGYVSVEDFRDLVSKVKSLALTLPE